MVLLIRFCHNTSGVISGVECMGLEEERMDRIGLEGKGGRMEVTLRRI